MKALKNNESLNEQVHCFILKLFFFKFHFFKSNSGASYRPMKGIAGVSMELLERLEQAVAGSQQLASSFGRHLIINDSN